MSVFDSENDFLDYIRFYIKGRMVDYIIDTETQKVISGNTFPESFAEYWKFIRQENEKDKLFFNKTYFWRDLNDRTYVYFCRFCNFGRN